MSEPLPQQISGHYGTCARLGSPNDCPDCGERWRADRLVEEHATLAILGEQARILAESVRDELP